MKKRVVSWLLLLALLIQVMPMVTFAQEQDLGTVRVIVENTTATAADSYCWRKDATPWTGVLVDTTVPLKADSTMTTCVVDALGDSHTIAGAENDYITEVDGLIAESSNGWMCTLNDWFTNEGIGNFTVADGNLESGDELRLMYTMRMGADLGSIFEDTTKTLKGLAVTGGTLGSAFSAANKQYEVALGEGVTSGTLTVIPEAYNKNFQVRVYKGQSYDPAEPGYKRGQAIAVTEGDTIQVVVGDPQWPSMNNGAYGGADEVEAGVYTLKVVQTAKDPNAGFSAFFEGLDGIATVSNSESYPFQVTEDGTALVSTNVGIHSSESALTFTFQKEANFSFQYKTSAENRWDFLKISLNDTALNDSYSDKQNFSGEMAEFKPYELQVSQGDVVKVVFAKDSSGSQGQDCAWLKGFSAALPYSVTFHANDGTDAVTEQGIFGTAALQPNSFVRPGYRFGGWATEPNGQAVYDDGAEITLTENVDLYAVWTAVWAVTFPNMPQGAAIEVKDAQGILQEPREDGSYLLADGDYTYSANLFGYEAVTDVAFTVKGAALEITETLTPSATYTVRFVITPQEAKTVIVLTNGEGTELSAKENGTYALPNGEYTYTIKAKGYAKATGTVQVEGADKEIPVTLEASTAWDGTTTAEPEKIGGVYQISCGDELAWFRDLVNTSVEGGKACRENAVLTDDIDLGDHPWKPISPVSRRGSSVDTSAYNGYNGTFDGQGYTVSGLSITTTEPGSGLFGYVYTAGVIRNLTVRGSIRCGQYAGGVAAVSAGRVEHCVNNVDISSNVDGKNLFAGGVVGYMVNSQKKAVVQDCMNHGNISCPNNSYIGGVVGNANYGVEVARCGNTGKVSGKERIGGVVGSSGIPVTGCYNTGAVTASKDPVGGVIGFTNKVVTDCYNQGNVTGVSHQGKSNMGVGGVIGWLHSDYGGSLTGCYNTGAVTDQGVDIVGALVGGKGTEKAVVRGYYQESTGTKGIGFGANDADEAVSMTQEDMTSMKLAGLLGGTFGIPAEAGSPVLTWQGENVRLVAVFLTEPADAQISVKDAQNQEQLPSGEKGVWILKPGTYTYSVSKSGYDTATETITMEGGSQAIAVTLTRQTFPVTFRVQPEDAAITVTDAEGTIVQPGAEGYRLDKGTYSYRVEKFGYVTKTGTFTVDNGPVEIPAINLEEAPKYDVTLDITYAAAAPQSATIFVYCGELLVGETSSLSLPDGDYTYRVVADGYFNGEGSFKVEGKALTVPVAMEVRSTWDGTISAPRVQDGVCQITSAQELAWFAKLVDEGNTKFNAILLSDIYVNDEASKNRWEPIGDFDHQYAGTFDGNGKTVYGLNDALFGYGAKGSLIRNVTVTGSIAGTSNAAGVCRASYGSFEGCINRADVSADGQRVGGIVGVVYDTGSIKNCANYGTITTSYNANGFQSYYKAYLGGIVGYSYAEVSGCANYGTVSATRDNYGGIGGIVGEVDQSPVRNCYNMGEISGPRRTAGLVGIANTQGAMVHTGYNAGTIKCTGSSADPFCGAVVGSVADPNGTTVGQVLNTYYLENSYYYRYNSSTIRTGGIGYGTGEATSKTEAELKAQDMVRTLGQAFRGDADGTLNQGYPVLAWQGGAEPEQTEDEKAVAADKAALTVTPTTVTAPMTLELAAAGQNGSVITWESGNPQIISNEGVVTLPKSETAVVTLTAKLTKGSASDSRSFEITVLSQKESDQKTLEKLTQAMGSVRLKPVFGTDTNIGTCLNQYAAKTIQKEGLPLEADRIQVSVTNVGVNANGTDQDAHIAQDGTISYFYQDPAVATMHGSTVRDIQFLLTYNEATVSVTAMAMIPWDADRVREDMGQIAQALTFDCIKGENADAAHVKSNLTLPVLLEGYGWSTIGWTSDSKVISVVPGRLPIDDCIGAVYPAQKDMEVTLTAQITFNKTSDDEPPITISKPVTVTVLGGNSLVDGEMQKALDAYTLDKLKDSETETPIDPAHVTGDIQLLTPRKLGIDGAKYALTVTAGNDAVEVNGYRANVYRPLPGQEAAQVPLTVTITHKATKKSLSKELGSITVLPMSQEEIDAEVALMEQVKANFFAGIANGNASADAVTGDLHPFQEVYRNGEDLVWVYNYKDRTYKGIAPTDIPKEGYDENYNLFHSSNPAVVKHENLLVRVPKNDTEVTITACLGSQTYGRYAKRYPDNEQFKKLTGQMVSVTVTVLGSNHDQQAANGVMELIDKIGNVTLDSEEAIRAAREAYEALTETQKKLVRNLETLEKAEKALEALKQAAEDQKAADQVSDLIDKIGEVTLDSEEAIRAAREAYEALTEPQKKLVRNLETLEKAEKALEALKQAAEDQKAADQVSDLIDKIGEVTLDSEEAIRAAREAYEALTETQKKLVRNVETLEKAEKALEDLKQAVEDQKAADQVSDLIDKIGEVTLDSEEAIRAAREAYEALTETQKKLVRNVETLEKAEKALEDLKQAVEDQKAADQVSDLIDKIGEVTLDSEKSIRAAREAYEALTETQKKLVRNLETLEKAEKALEALKQAAEDQKAADQVSDLIDKIGEVTLDSEEAIRAAREAYEALTENQKKLVKNLQTLIDAEKALAALQQKMPFEDVEQNRWYYEPVRYVWQKGIMEGISDTRFAPKHFSTRAMFVTILYRMAGEPETKGTSSFTDIPEKIWYRDAVCWAEEQGITEGVGNHLFAPGAFVTREQAAVMLMRYAEHEGYDTSASATLEGYTDADTISAWARPAMQWANAMGIMEGRSETRLVPRGKITRGEIATVAMRFMETAAKK